MVALIQDPFTHAPLNPTLRNIKAELIGDDEPMPSSVFRDFAAAMDDGGGLKDVDGKFPTILCYFAFSAWFNSHRNSYWHQEYRKLRERNGTEGSNDPMALRDVTAQTLDFILHLWMASKRDEFRFDHMNFFARNSGFADYYDEHFS